MYTVRFEGIHSSHVISLFVAECGAVDVADTGLNGTSVDNDSRAVVAGCSNHTTWHVLVASVRGLRYISHA